MKIAILTLPLHTNYGGILQAYALQTILQKMGHDVHVLSYLPCFYCRKKSSKIKIVLYYKLKALFKQLPNALWELYYLHISKSTNRYLNLFIKLQINEYFIADLNKLKQNIFDCFIVGSDQIWRPMYNGEIKNSFLYFAQGWNVKRIAYAPSFGTENWEYPKELTEICKNLIATFDAVSIREETGVQLCKEYLNTNSELMLDPTFLLTKEEYIDLFRINKLPKSKGNLLVYILDKSEFYEQHIKGIEDKYNLIANIVNIVDTNSNITGIKATMIPVGSWIRSFYDSDLIITDSFHACVFSLIFNKPFIVLRNNKRGNTRIDNLLNIFNQKFRIMNIEKNICISEELFNKPNVYEIIQEKRKESLNFLRESLHSR